MKLITLQEAQTLQIVFALTSDFQQKHKVREVLNEACSANMVGGFYALLEHQGILISEVENKLSFKVVIRFNLPKDNEHESLYITQEMLNALGKLMVRLKKAAPAGDFFVAWELEKYEAVFYQIWTGMIYSKIAKV